MMVVESGSACIVFNVVLGCLAYLVFFGRDVQLEIVLVGFGITCGGVECCLTLPGATRLDYEDLLGFRSIKQVLVCVVWNLLNLVIFFCLNTAYACYMQVDLVAFP